MPVNERNLYFEGRCRPWYLSVKNSNDTDSIILNDPYFGAISSTDVFFTLSTAINNLTTGKMIGVTASDISTGFINNIMEQIF